MGKQVSLDEVSASVLPANVLVLLSKYAQAMRKQTGLVIKISSLSVFKHVHNTNKLTDHLQIEQLHRDLCLEVNRHLRAGTMQTNQDRELGGASSITRVRGGEVIVSRNSVASNSNKLEKESSL